MSSQDPLSPQRSSPPRASRSLTGTLDRSRSRSYVHNDISIDEGVALKRITQAAEEKLESEQRKNAEARKYWHERRDQEQSRFSDEEMETGSSSIATTSTPISGHPRITGILDDLSEPSSRGSRNTGSRPSSAMSHSEDNSSEVIKQWQDKFNELDTQYKESMVSNAKLYDEKTALVFQVESLKDLLEDRWQEVHETKAESQRIQSQLLHSKHSEDSLGADIQRLKSMITYRNDYLESLGLTLPTGEEGEEEEELPQVFPVEERDQLLKQIAHLKAEVETVKTSHTPSADSLLHGEETKDIVRESTRLVSEFKTKLQIAQAETTRLEGTVERLKGQVGRYKNQMEEMEQREDELLKEKRGQSREVRRLQSLVDDLESENELLKRRVEQMRKRQKD